MRLSPRLLLLLVLGIALTTFGVVRWLSHGDVGVAPTPEGTTIQQADPNAGKTTDNEGDARTVLPTSPTKPEPSGAPTGIVHIVVQANGRAVPGCTVAVGSGLSAMTDAEGKAMFELPPQRLWLDVTPPKDAGLCTYKSRLTIDRGITKTVPVALTPKTSALWCRIVDSVTQKPLAEATILVHPREHQPYTTDQQGLVELVMQPADEYGLASAEGHASRRIALESGYDSEANALVVPLEPSATLEVTCQHADGKPVVDAMVAIRALASDMQWPRNSAATGGAQTWSNRTDKDGKASIPSLPSRTKLYLEISAPGSVAPPTTGLELKAGTNEHTVTLPGAGVIRGRVLDAASQPVNGAVVACMPTTSQDTPAVFPSGNFRGDTVTTGADGRFELTPLAPGAWIVGLHQTEGWAGRCVRVELPTGGTAEADVRAERELAISGRLFGPEGNTMSAFEVRAEHAGTIIATAITEPGGAFRLAPLLPGDYDLTTELYNGNLALPKPMRVTAGTSGVSLRVGEVTGSVRGTVESETARGGEIYVTGFRREGTESTEQLCDADGGFVMEHLRAGTWDFVARDVHGQVAARPAVLVEIRRDVLALELALVRGAKIRPLHPEADACVVRRGDAVIAKAQLTSGLPAEIVIPPGKCTIVFFRSGIQVARTQAVARIGEDQLIDGSR
jgi:uncharacterized GH25 family protein